jgi:hypothetical protein
MKTAAMKADTPSAAAWSPGDGSGPPRAATARTIRAAPGDVATARTAGEPEPAAQG